MFTFKRIFRYTFTCNSLSSLVMIIIIIKLFFIPANQCLHKHFHFTPFFTHCICFLRTMKQHLSAYIHFSNFWCGSIYLLQNINRRFTICAIDMLMFMPLSFVIPFLISFQSLITNFSHKFLFEGSCCMCRCLCLFAEKKGAQVRCGLSWGFDDEALRNYYFQEKFL